MPATVLVRYGELALKSPPVRREFERALAREIVRRLAARGTACQVRSDHGHLYVTGDDPVPLVATLGLIFGITSVSEVRTVASQRDAIREAVSSIAAETLPPTSSFAIRARRVGTHPFTSQDLARDLGAAVLARCADREVRVDLTHPDVELEVEVRGPVTYLSHRRYPGPGGLPPGVAGHVVALVDGPRGALGAYLMMKRGCTVGIVSMGSDGRSAAESLRKYAPNASETEVTGPPEGSLAEMAERVRADAVVLPLGVADYPDARARWSDRVVFSPTVAFSDAEVATRWAEVVRRAS